jgi:hypothetical protein
MGGRLAAPPTGWWEQRWNMPRKLAARGAIAVQTAERTAEPWKALEQADALPEELKDSIGKQILGVAARVM